MILSVDIHHNIQPQDQEFGEVSIRFKRIYIYFAAQGVEVASLGTLRVSCRMSEIGYSLLH